MKETVLTADRLGKCYVSYRNNIARFGSWFGFPARHTHEYWAIKEVSFSLRRGEAIGLIGKNGAGKSSLLKLITGTVRQTTGTVELKGRVSAILELGLGFNPDFTGVQNVYLAGGMMGFSTEEISDFIPEIQKFAELGNFFEEPLRHYSSGMQARLAFALATCKQPDLLIVDEALSVGDMAFQRKCFRRIEGFMEAGTSLLFVSHDIESVRRLCKDAIYLKDGHMAFFGSSKEACDFYERDAYGSAKGLAEKNSVVESVTEESILYDEDIPAVLEDSYGNGDAVIFDCWIENETGRTINVVRNGDSFVWCYKVRFFRYVKNPVFGMRLKAIDGVDVFSTNTEMLHAIVKPGELGTEITIRFVLSANLAPNIYFLNAGVSEKNTADEIAFLHRRIDAKAIKIVNRNIAVQFGGIADLQAMVSLVAQPSETIRQCNDGQ